MYDIRMLYFFDSSDFSEEIDVSKTSASKECNICHYWYFLNYSFKFQPNVCNRCHDLLMMSMNPSDNAIFNIKGSDHHCTISLISKNKAIKVMQNAEHYKTPKSNFEAVNEKSGNYKLKKYQMEKTIIKFGDVEIKKQKFHQHKTPISVKNIATNKLVVSNKVSFGKKIFIRYKDAKITPLCIF